jgi:molybdopterin-synthase adenylyltransferase
VAETVYDRQLLIQGWRQDLLTAATVVIAGVGAIGNEVAKNLALAGVGRLIACDPDAVSVSNLNRTVLFRAADVGRAKAEAAVESLRRLAPDTRVHARVQALVSGVGLGELADADVVVGCVDTMRARMQLLGRCALVDAPLIDTGSHPWGGEIRLRLSAVEPCHGCTLSEHDRGRSDLPWSCHESWPAGPEPATIATTALIAAWASTAVLGLLLGQPPTWRILAVRSAGGAEPVQIARDLACPFHRPLAGPIPTIPVSAQATVADLLAALGPEDEPESWADFELPLRCRACGHRPELARDGVGSCGRCGALVKSKTTTRLREADPARSLSDLGVAPEEILSIRGKEGGLRCVRLSPG